MSDGKETYNSAPDHDGTHKDRQTTAVTGGASAAGGPASADNPKGEVSLTNQFNQPAFLATPSLLSLRYHFVCFHGIVDWVLMFFGCCFLL